MSAFLGCHRSADIHGNDTSAELRPNALALFNPALAIRGSESAARLGLSPEEMDALDFDDRIGADYPPSWIWYGADDSIYHRAQPTIDRMVRECPRVELLVEDGASHGYFNDFERYFRSSFSSLEGFLRSLGYIAESTA